MDNLEVSMSRETFNQILACYANSYVCLDSSGMVKASVVFERMQEEGHRPDVFTYNAMIFAAAGLKPRCGNRELAEHYFSKMMENRSHILRAGKQNTSMGPNSETFLALLRACAYDKTDGSKHSRAWGLVSSMQDTFDLKPSAQHFSMLRYG